MCTEIFWQHPGRPMEDDALIRLPRIGFVVVVGKGHHRMIHRGNANKLAGLTVGRVQFVDLANFGDGQLLTLIADNSTLAF